MKDFSGDKEIEEYIQDITRMSKDIIILSKMPLINKVFFYKRLVNKSSKDGFNNKNDLRNIIKYLHGLLKLDLDSFRRYNIIDENDAMQQFYKDEKKGKHMKKLTL